MRWSAAAFPRTASYLAQLDEPSASTAWGSQTVVLVLDEDDRMVTEALDLPPSSTIVVRPSRMRSPNGAMAVLTYA